MASDDSQLSFENLMIAAPCDVDWDDMVGGETVRRCNDCKLNVYNVKNLTRKEVESLLAGDQAQSGNLCVQLYRRADGTLLTKDCPRGLARVRAFSGRLWRTVASMAAALLAGNSALAQDKGKTSTTAEKEPPPMTRTGGIICPPSLQKKDAPKQGQTSTEDKSADDKSKDGKAADSKDHHSSKAHTTALNLYKEGQQLEKSGAFARAVEVYQEALTTMSTQKHDPKFHLKIETALSRVKAKAGINQ